MKNAEIDSNSVFLKRWMLQKRQFSCYFQSITYNDVIVTKQIYLSLTFLKSWIHIFDNIASVIGIYGKISRDIGIWREK